MKLNYFLKNINENLIDDRKMNENNKDGNETENEQEDLVK